VPRRIALVDGSCTLCTNDSDGADGTLVPMPSELSSAITRYAAASLVAVDESNRCLLVNPAFERLTGWSEAELIGRPFHDIARHVTPDGPPFPDEECALERARELNEETSGSEMLVCKDGRSVPAGITATPCPDGLVLTIRDLTAERRAQDQLRAAVRRKDEFLALLGHELRNPLAPIMTAIQLMRLRGVRDMEREREIIERQLRHLVRLVDDLLDVSRVTRGKIRIRRDLIEIGDTISRAVEMASPLFEERSHNLSLSVPRRGLALRGDRDRLAQVFANLLTNAAKFTEPGGRVTVAASRSGDDIVVSVRDTGIGISTETLPRIFDLFEQGERQPPGVSGGLGLGLGLALVRSLVRLHGGTVAAHSDGPGRGTEMIVTLPAAVEASASTARLPTPPPEGGPALRVLVVDDNVDAALILGETLRSLGHVVEVAHDGVQALDVAQELKPDVAVLDIDLPVMDGYELAARLRSMLEPAPARLIALTGYGQDSDRARSQEAGFAEHLVKPIDLSALINAIRGS
jgi:PAS domain S-box-containing protein